MTDQNLIVQTTPMVQVVTADLERVFAFSEIALEGDDPATISDADLKARVARFMDVDAHTFDNLIVTRPGTGNVLLAPKPTYGNDAMDILASLGALIVGIFIIAIAIFIAPLWGYVIGWLLSHVFVFAGRWITDGANQLSIKLTLDNLPVVCAFLAFVFSFLPKVKHDKS